MAKQSYTHYFGQGFRLSILGGNFVQPLAFGWGGGRFICCSEVRGCPYLGGKKCTECMLLSVGGMQLLLPLLVALEWLGISGCAQ